MGSFSNYEDLADLTATWEDLNLDRPAAEEELDYLFGRNRKRQQIDHYADNEDFGQF